LVHDESETTYITVIRRFYGGDKRGKVHGVVRSEMSEDGS